MGQALSRSEHRRSEAGDARASFTLAHLASGVTAMTAAASTPLSKSHCKSSAPASVD